MIDDLMLFSSHECTEQQQSLVLALFVSFKESRKLTEKREKN